MSKTRAYNSPLREEQAKATREAILQALFELMQSAEDPENIGMDEIGRLAGVQRRTIFRHFASKEVLYANFWPWMNARMGVSPTPQTLAEVVDGPRNAFPRFEEFEPIMRAMIHTPAGREMRASSVEGRRLVFAGALASVCEKLPPEKGAKVTALAHLLYSAATWEVLKDYGGLSGAQAGETASWALEVILSAVTEGEGLADKSTQDMETNDDD